MDNSPNNALDSGSFLPYHNLQIIWHIIQVIIWWLFDAFLMIFWWSFDDYFVYMSYLINLSKYAKWTNNPISHSPGYAASKYRWSELHGSSLICPIHHCKAFPLILDVCGEYHANARIQTRHNTCCIWNSKTVWSAWFFCLTCLMVHWQPLQHVMFEQGSHSPMKQL